MNSSVAFCASAASAEVQRRLDDHPVRGGERAGGLRLRRPGRDLAEAHAAGADGRPEPGLVAEDRDLDPGRERRLDEPGALRHRDLDAVDRQRDELGAGSCVRLDQRAACACWATGARTPSSGESAERAAAAVEVRDELVPELVDVARDRHRGGVAERAEALAVDPVADGEQQVELVLATRRRPRACAGSPSSSAFPRGTACTCRTTRARRTRRRGCRAAPCRRARRARSRRPSPSPCSASAASRSRSRRRSRPPVRITVDEPPGITAFSAWPSGMPPPRSSA